MAFGGLKGTLTGNANNIGSSLAISTGGPITVAVGDLIYAVIAEQATASVTACGDNLHGGSTYAATSAAADAGTICTGRAFWKRVTTAGSLSSVTFVTAATTNNVVAIAAVIEGPFARLAAGCQSGEYDQRQHHALHGSSHGNAGPGR